MSGWSHRSWNPPRETTVGHLCLWGGASASLREAGYDVVGCGEWETDPGDQEILYLAYAQSRILVTLDKDFGERAIVFGEPLRGIIRLVDIPARQQAECCLRILSRYNADSQSA